MIVEFELNLAEKRVGPFSLVEKNVVEQFGLNDGDLILVEANPRGDKRRVVRWWFYFTSGRQVAVPSWLRLLARRNKSRWGVWDCAVVGVIPTHPAKRRGS